LLSLTFSLSLYMHTHTQLVNNMLREQRISIANPLLSEDPEGNRRRLKEQMSIYSMQFKAAQNAFGKQRVALSGKVGGMKDDVIITCNTFAL